MRFASSVNFISSRREEEARALNTSSSSSWQEKEEEEKTILILFLSFLSISLPTWIYNQPSTIPDSRSTALKSIELIVSSWVKKKKASKKNKFFVCAVQSLLLFFAFHVHFSSCFKSMPFTTSHTSIPHSYVFFFSRHGPRSINRRKKKKMFFFIVTVLIEIFHVLPSFAFSAFRNPSCIIVMWWFLATLYCHCCRLSIQFTIQWKLSFFLSRPAFFHSFFTISPIHWHPHSFFIHWRRECVSVFCQLWKKEKLKKKLFSSLVFFKLFFSSITIHRRRLRTAFWKDNNWLWTLSSIYHFLSLSLSHLFQNPKLPFPSLGHNKWNFFLSMIISVEILHFIHSLLVHWKFRLKSFSLF